MKIITSVAPRGLRPGWTTSTVGRNINSFPVDETGFSLAHAETGSIYFILNPALSALKIGFSRSPERRLKQLQTGNSVRLLMVGLVASPRAIERVAHQEFGDLSISGEWFANAPLILDWLNKVTNGRPLRASRWEFGEMRETWWIWDPATETHRRADD